MSVTNGYCTIAELGEVQRVHDSADDALYGVVIESVSRSIDEYCDRWFYQDGTATARVYRPCHGDLIEVDDISGTASLTIKTDDDEDGVYETTWTAADYQLEPLNNLADGRPVWLIRNVSDSLTFPVSVRSRATVEVTALWGWPSVPKPVNRACVRQAQRMLKLGDAPLGVLMDPNSGEPMTVQLDKDVKAWLAPFRKHPFGLGD